MSVKNSEMDSNHCITLRTQTSPSNGSGASSTGTTQASGVSRASAVSQITGRPVAMDFDEIGEDQYLQDHAPWASYKDETVDRDAYLNVLKDTPLVHFANVSNQRPSAFPKKDMYRHTEHGPPFQTLKEHNQLILNGKLFIESAYLYNANRLYVL